MPDFVHLHLHTEYSLLDGATRLPAIFDKCGKLGMPAVAITDHGNMYGALEFVKTAIRYTDPKADPFDFIKERRPFKVKPIIGCEVYVTENMDVRVAAGGKMPKLNHLVLLAKNETGYKNLIKMVSEGYTRGLYYKPRIDFNLLKDHAEGIICLSACLAGELPQALLNNDMDKAYEVVDRYKALFGDDYYVEIQDHNIADQKRILPLLIKVARDRGVKIVATNDVHYLNKEDSLMQKVLQCISFRRTLDLETERTYVLASLRMAQELFSRPGRVSGLVVRLRDGADAVQVRDAVAQQLGGDYRVRTRYELRASFYRIMTYEKWGIFFISLLVLVVASFSVVGSLAMLIVEKRRDIGTLRALGADTTLVRSIFRSEGLLICALGAALGVALGVGATLLQQHFGLIEIPAETFLTKSYPVEFRPGDLAAVLAAFGVVACVISNITVRSMIKTNVKL